MSKERHPSRTSRLSVGSGQYDPVAEEHEEEIENGLGRKRIESSVDDDDVYYLGSEGLGPSPNCCDRGCLRFFPSGFSRELKAMFKIGWPIVVTQVCQMVLGPISLIFCGHLGDPIQLDGAALAISMINATGIAVAQGLGTACDTFFSQTYGSRNRKQVGAYVQKAFIIFALALLCCYALHINMETVLRLFGQDPRVARLAGRYLIIFMPGTASFFMYIVLAKYIQNQNIVIPNVIIGLVANGVNALLHYILLYQLNMSTDGSAIAQAAAYCCMFLLTFLYILFSGIYKETWGGWSTQCLLDWGRFARIAVPGMLMVCLEWWGFEIGVFLSGLLGTTELGAQSVVLQIDSIWFQVPMGIQIATSIRVGQYLGAGNPIGAMTTGRLGITLVFMISVPTAITFLILRNYLPYIFTNVEIVADLVGRLLPIVTLYMFFDGMATACKGVLYGTGRQIFGAVILFVSYYVLSLPIGIPLMFLSELRTAAYWWALAINMVIQSCVLGTLVYKTNWEDQCRQARERAGLLGDKVEEIGQPSERTGLLSHQSSRRRSSTRRMSVGRGYSASISISEIKHLIAEPPSSPTSEMVCRRIVTVLLVLCVFGIGLACYILVRIPDDMSFFPGVNTTMSTV